ncbi:MAG TPA: hypothetical protein VHM88_27790 [Candidatus Acidoferrales bacterium]|nr:hypothetical protein [Candidatus Acidoferrales bacterium]
MPPEFLLAVESGNALRAWRIARESLRRQPRLVECPGCHDRMREPVFLAHTCPARMTRSDKLAFLEYRRQERYRENLRLRART